MIGYLATFLKSTTAFTAVCTIAGVLIGFFAGIYLPMGMFPPAVRNVLNALPFTSAAMLFRLPFMALSKDAVLTALRAESGLVEYYGMNVTIGSFTVTPLYAVLYLVIIGAVFFTLSIFRIKNKL